jgi:hypothetical protein
LVKTEAVTSLGLAEDHDGGRLHPDAKAWIIDHV